MMDANSVNYVFGRLLVELYVLFFSVVIDQVSEDELNNNTERVNVSIYKMRIERTTSIFFSLYLVFVALRPSMYTYALSTVQLDERKGRTIATTAKKK